MLHTLIQNLFGLITAIHTSCLENLKQLYVSVAARRPRQTLVC
jgi:hypothetical protein